MRRRLAASLVGLYPLAWRERYEDEVLALIDDSPVRLHDLGELVRGLIVERARALIEDADHPSRTSAILVWMQPAFVIAFMVFAWSIGVGLRTWRGPLPPGFDEAGMVLIQAFYLGFIGTKFVVLRRSKGKSPLGLFPAWTALMLLPVFFAGIAVATWGRWAGFTADPLPLWLRLSLSLLLCSVFILELTYSFWPGRKMLEAIGRLAGADSQIRWARLWIEGCETMIAQGVPSPLDQAQSQLAEGQRNRESALEQLQRLGYRARFQL
jgi:hypothetical protein